MSPGFIVDTRELGMLQEQRWVRGEPERGYYLGGLKTKGRDVYLVTTYRCGLCGYLESYATEPGSM